MKVTPIPIPARDRVIGVSLYLPTKVNEHLDRLAAETGQSRSGIVTMLINAPPLPPIFTPKPKGDK